MEKKESKKVSKKDTKEKEIKNKEKEIKIEKDNKLTDKQKELIITIIVLVASVVVGFFIGKVLFDAMYK